MVLSLIWFCLMLGGLTVFWSLLENCKFKIIGKWSDISKIIILENLFNDYYLYICYQLYMKNYL